MIPKYLKIKGLYSYQKEQEIHFDVLTGASLFGIFGSVGSGKSSILEAITFALYGDTERLNKSGDERTYNMMNLRSDELLIDFECLAGKSADLYRFTVKGKRNSKNFKEVKTFERKAYIWKENEWLPLGEHETTESIIGLSYDNFRRTIIIPQGRFQEFIELKDAERTRMMKELFQLERYDLSRNVSALNKRNDLELSGIDGQLMGLTEVSAEVIDQEEKNRAQIGRQIKDINGQLLLFTAQLDQMQKLKAAFEKAQQLQIQLRDLESRQTEIQDREEQLRVFEICSIHFKTFLDRKRSLSDAISRDRLSVTTHEKRISELTEHIARQKEILTSLEKSYENRQELLDTAEELEKVIRIIELYEQQEKNKGALLRGEQLLSEKEAAIDLLKKEKLTREEENEGRKNQLADVHELSLVKSWFATSDEILETLKTVKKEEESLLEEIEKVRVLADEKITKANQFFSLKIAPGPGLAEISARVQEYLTGSEAERENLAKQTVAIQTQLALNQYAATLTDGAPCPLCGSEHHPSVLHADHTLAVQIAEKEARRETLLKMDQSIRRFQSAVEKDFGQLEHLEKQKQAINTKLREVKERMVNQDARFVWSRFDKTDRKAFDSYFNEIEKNQKEIRDNELLIKRLSAAIETALSERVEKIEKPIQALRNEALKIENTISTLVEQLEKVNLKDVQELGTAVISEKIVALKRSFNDIKEQYEKAELQTVLLEKEKNTIAGSLNTLSENLTNSQKELQSVESTIGSQLTAHGFESEGQVAKVLLQTIHIETERKVIDVFKTALNTTKRDLELLRLENQDQVYEAERHDLLIKEKEQLTLQLNALRKEEGRLEGLLKKMADDLSKKALLLNEKSRLQIRKEHLDDLARLFRSSGFVDYASSIYLQNLVQAANHRFHRMTHQQLHLELGEGNSFWVRDLLNSGHMRLLKTLSGGQKFQAALSLALALADHIHIRNESSHNFFFLDEGFGSLDKEALLTVFETLKSLGKENRIVGIISHVEDLQQEIQTYLRIERGEEGSTIEASWK
jgi:exonuclease SbcC